MDFLGAMFKGIGDTFTAGANVDTTKLQAENAGKDRDLMYESLYFNDRQNKLAFLNADAANEQRLILIVVGSIVLMAMIFLIMKMRKANG